MKNPHINGIQIVQKGTLGMKRDMYTVSVTKNRKRHAYRTPSLQEAIKLRYLLERKYNITHRGNIIYYAKPEWDNLSELEIDQFLLTVRNKNKKRSLADKNPVQMINKNGTTIFFNSIRQAQECLEETIHPRYINSDKYIKQGRFKDWMFITKKPQKKIRKTPRKHTTIANKKVRAINKDGRTLEFNSLKETLTYFDTKTNLNRYLNQGNFCSNTDSPIYNWRFEYISRDNSKSELMTDRQRQNKIIFQIPTKSGEIWKPYEGEHKYLIGILYVSNLGRIYRIYGKHGAVLGLTTDGQGYKKLHISVKRIDHILSVHRLVAETFCLNDDPQHKKVVDHINAIRDDNRACNLHWVTTAGNCQNPIYLKKLSKDKKKEYWQNTAFRTANNKAIKAISISGEIKYFNSEKEVQSYFGSKSNVRRILRRGDFCRSHKSPMYGWKFEYVNTKDDPHYYDKFDNTVSIKATNRDGTKKIFSSINQAAEYFKGSTATNIRKILFAGGYCTGTVYSIFGWRFDYLNPADDPTNKPLN